MKTFSRKFFAECGRRGGLKKRLTRRQAQNMVRIRELKRRQREQAALSEEKK